MRLETAQQGLGSVSEMRDRLLYRRQFLIARRPVPGLADWTLVEAKALLIYAHPDLPVCMAASGDRGLVVLGAIFDPRESTNDDADIARTLLADSENVDELILKLKCYFGSYLCVYYDELGATVWSDARGLREVYYCEVANRIVCGSQPHVVARFADPPIERSADPELMEFCEKQLWDSRWVGTETCFQGVRHMLPNHRLDVRSGAVARYWPSEPVRAMSFEDVVAQCCEYLQGAMRAIVRRHSAMMAVTAGTDSRTLLAASKGVVRQIECFVNRHNMAEDDPDIVVSTTIMRGIAEPFRVNAVGDEVDEEFRRLYFESTFLADPRLLPSIYDVYYRHGEGKVLILGVGETGRTFFGKEPKTIDGQRLAYRLGYGRSSYVIRQCDRYLQEMMPAARRWGVNPMHLAYWEQRLGNWGATRHTESQIAIEKIDPFNSHELNELFLAVDEDDRDYQDSPCRLFAEMIRTMWPELLEWPVNPPRGLRDTLRSWTMKAGLFEMTKEARFQASRCLYRWSRRKLRGVSGDGTAAAK